MASYSRGFCAWCKGYSVTVDGECLHHRHKAGECRDCKCKLEEEEGHYRFGGMQFCIECGEKYVRTLEFK